MQNSKLNYKKLALLVVFLAFLLSVRVAFADYKSAYSDYSFRYGQYRQAVSDYQIAKNKYLTYKTLAAQAEAVEAMKKILAIRDEILLSHLEVLLAKTGETPNFDELNKKIYHDQVEEAENYLLNHKFKAEAASSLADLNALSQEMEGKGDAYRNLSGRMRGSILVAKEDKFKTGFERIFNKISDDVRGKNLEGKNTVNLERGLLNVKAKKDLFEVKLGQAKKVLNPEDPDQPSDLVGGQGLVQEANQYLREALGFLREINRQMEE